MKRYIILVLSILISFSVTQIAKASDITNISEFHKPIRTGNWQYNAYYQDDFEQFSRTRYDAWTTSGDVSFVVSCEVDRISGASKFRLFIASNVPIHRLRTEVPVRIMVGKDRYDFTGRVSSKYVGNVFVYIDKESMSEVVERMRAGNWASVRIPSVASVYPLKADISLKGFTKATLNPVTVCTVDE